MVAQCIENSAISDQVIYKIGTSRISHHLITRKNNYQVCRLLPINHAACRETVTYVQNYSQLYHMTDVTVCPIYCLRLTHLSIGSNSNLQQNLLLNQF